MDRELLQKLVDSLGDAVLAIDSERRFLIVNEAARALLEFEAKPGDLLSDAWSASHAVVGEDGKPLAYEDTAFARGLRGLPTDRLVFSWPRGKDGHPVWVEVCARPVRDDAGAVIAVVAGYRDVSTVHAMTRALARSDQLLRAVLANLPNGATFLVDRELRYVAADGPALPEVLRRAGVSDLVGHTVGELSQPEHRVANEQMFERTLNGESVRLESRRGETTYELSTVPIQSGDVVTHALLLAYDVTQRERDRALLAATLAHIHDGVVLLDAERRILLANQAYEKMFELSPARMAALTRAEFVEHIAAMTRDPDDTRSRLAEATEAPLDLELIRPVRRVLRRTGTHVDAGGAARYLVTWHDVTAEVDLLQERDKLTMLDPLTGIANRRLADRTLSREIDRMTRAKSELSIALLDVDHFKRVNDTYGHNTGDAVLQRVARILTDTARGSDTVARWGGEEFIAILPVGLAGARVFGERARAALEADATDELPRVTISVGLAEVGPGEAAVAAVARADARLYEAKQRGRNRVEG